MKDLGLREEAIMRKYSVQEIIEAWVEWTGYDEDRSSFNLMDMSYELHKGTKLAQRLAEEYDKSGKLSLVLIRSLYRRATYNTKIRLSDIFDKKDMITELEKMNEMLNSEEARLSEEAVRLMLGSLYRSVTGISLLDTDKNWEVLDNIDDIISDAEKLNKDIYASDGEEIHINKFMQSVLVFNTLGEAVLKLENSEDALYVCYINVGNTADGYFAFFIKSGNNLVSFNDRIDERYPGQHNVLNTRNGRWSLDKRYNIFPYNEILDFSKYCPKGCAMSYKVKGESTKGEIYFKDIANDSGYFRLVLAILLIKLKYDGKGVDGEKVYIESLIGERLENVETAIVPVDGSSIIAGHNSINLNLGVDKITAWKDENELSKILVNRYAGGFVPNYSKIYTVENTKQLLLGDGSDSGSIRPEYVGSYERIEQGALYELREQLADYIEKQLDAEYTSIGRDNGFYKWYVGLLYYNRYKILEKLVKVYKDNPDRPRFSVNGVSINVENTDWPCYILKRRILNDFREESRDFKCMISDYKANIFFTIDGVTLEGFKWLLDEEPDDFKKLAFMKKGYIGNSLLQMVDPVSKIELPFGGSECTKFAIGISKRELKKIEKKL